MAVDLAAYIRDIRDYPKPGIVFKDVMPLFAVPEALHEAVDQLAAWAEPRRRSWVTNSSSLSITNLPKRSRLRAVSTSCSTPEQSVCALTG